MVCIYCGKETDVINSRRHKQSNRVWRRRQCTQCGNVFTTHEIAELAGAFMVRGAGAKLLPFSRDKLFISIYKSCGHRKHAQQDASGLVDTVIAQLFPASQPNKAEISREEIGNAAFNVLTNFDQAAAIAYRAYHPA